MSVREIHINGSTGDDANDGTSGNPVETIPAANALAREHLITNRTDLIQCLIAAGTYETSELYLGEGVYADACQVSWRGGFVDVGSSSTVTSVSGDDLHTKLYGVDGTLELLARVTRSGVLVLPEIPFARQGSDHARLDVDARACVEDGDDVQGVEPSVRINGLGSVGSISLGGKGCLWNHDPGGGSPLPGGANGWAFEALLFGGTIFAQGAYGAFFDRCVFEGGDHNFRGGCSRFVNCVSRGALGMLLYGGHQNGHDQAGSRPRETTTNGSVDAPAMEILMCGGGSIFLGFDGGDAAASGAQWVQERNISIYDSAHSLVMRGNSTVFKMQRSDKVRGRLLALQGDGNAKCVNVREGARFQCIPSRCKVDNTGANDIDFDGASGGGKSWGEIDANATHFVDANFGTMVTKHWT